MNTVIRTAVPLMLVALLSACGGGSNGGGTTPTPNPNPTPTPNPSPTPDTSLRTQLAKCPMIAGTTDPTASTCLAGTYTGKTPLGAACTLTISANGNYTYSSPQLSASVTMNGKEIRTFYSSPAGGGNYFVGWSNSGSYETNTSDQWVSDTDYDLDFAAKFGPAASNTVEITLDKTFQPPTGDRQKSASSCIVNL